MNRKWEVIAKVLYYVLALPLNNTALNYIDLDIFTQH